MAVGYQAWREAGEGRVGERFPVWVLWKFGIGDCGICFQAGYIVSSDDFILLGQLRVLLWGLASWLRCGCALEVGMDRSSKF